LPIFIKLKFIHSLFLDCSMGIHIKAGKIEKANITIIGVSSSTHQTNRGRIMGSVKLLIT
jgi:hypothetical protein